MIIYNISAKAESGKDTVCKFIEEFYEKRNMKVCHLLFAKRIKQYAIDYFGWDGREETKPRHLLQNMGTEVIRDKLNNPNFHVNSVIQDIEILSNYFDIFVTSDLRFYNELALVKDRFKDSVKSVRINRPNHKSKLNEQQLQHKSETELDNYSDWDYVIVNDSNLEDLKYKVERMLLNES